MFKVLLLAVLAWFLYNLVFRFIIPIYKTSRQMKQKFREMHERMQDQMNPPQENKAGPAPSTAGSSKAAAREDYIDFEEIK